MAAGTEDLIYSEYADELRIRGIFAGGYGVIPKLAVLDASLSLEAKALLAYFCSFSGNGCSVFPGREKILNDLGITKDSFYKYLKQLIGENYISVQQQTNGNRFGKNIYTLISLPEKYAGRTCAPAGQMGEISYIDSIKSGGYGLVAKKIMQDPRLCIKSKGLYAYYTSFAAAGRGSVCPEKPVIMEHLKISAHTLEKLNRELQSCNYIIVRQRHVNGRLGVNDVLLIENPDLDHVEKHTIQVLDGETRSSEHTHTAKRKYRAEIQDGKKQDTECGASVNFDVQSAKISDTEIQDGKKQDTEKSDSKNTRPKQYQPSNSTSDNITSQEEEILARYEAQKKALREILGRGEAVKTCSAQETRRRRQATVALFAQKTIPDDWLQDPALIKTCIEILLEDDVQGAEENYSEDQLREYKAYTLFRDSLTELLTHPGVKVLNGRTVTSATVLARLRSFIRIRPESLTIELRDICEDAKAAYLTADAGSVKVPRRYMQACILNAMDR